MMPGAHHVGQRQQVGQQGGVGSGFDPDQGAVGEGYPDLVGLRAADRDAVPVGCAPEGALRRRRW